MPFSFETQFEKAKLQAKTTGNRWYLIKFENSDKFRAVSESFFASQPHLRKNVVNTLEPW